MIGMKYDQHPGKLAAQEHDKNCGEHEGKELLQEFREHARHGELHALDVVDDGRDQCAGGVLGKKGCRATQDRVVQVIAQVRDHAEAGMVYQVGPGVVEDSL